MTEGQIDIVEDYKNYFEEDVPSNACIAIMGDADNAHSKIQSFLRYIETSKNLKLNLDIICIYS